MEPDFIIGIGGIALLFILIFIGMPIAPAAMLIGFFGVLAVRDWNVAAALAGFLPHAAVSKYALSVIPLFILMGYFANLSGLIRQLFRAGRLWVGQLPGGLAMATALSCAGFAAVSGSSVATSAMMAETAVPEMERSHYDRKLALGVVAASGTLAALIPPSALIVIYGILTEQSIARLLIAGFLPGILSVGIYCLLIYARTRFNPALAPKLPRATWKERFLSLKGLGGILVVALIVVGGIYLGVFSPTEAAGVGAFVLFIMALASRELTFAKLVKACTETIRTTAMLFFIIVGVFIFIRLLSYTGLSALITNSILSLSLPPMMVVALILCLYVLLGMIMDPMGMLMLTLPIVIPAVSHFGFSLIWFGVMVVKMSEFGLITPPVGITCYAVKSAVPGARLEDIFRGVVPFYIADAITIAILFALPQISLFLPSTM
ncbi:TRAP transporter large permease [Chloroflexota bacterium]